MPDNEQSKKLKNPFTSIAESLKRKREFKHEEKQQNKARERSLIHLLREDREREAAENEVPSSFISLRHVNKVYPNLVQAVYDFNLDINEKEFIVLVGPSGCGKSTTLRMIAGLEDITTGDLYLKGVKSNNVPAKDRNMAMVFQSYALYPHLNVYDNMAFSLKLRHVDKKTIYERVKEAAKILELGDYLDRKPKELSGGQRQRVALGRAIVRNADIFLMDEPLSNLDAKLRVQMRSEIVRIHRAVGATTIYVTHDQTEAMTMADRIVVMKLGHIQQIGTPEEIFDRPANLFVAGFIGSPAMNLINSTYDGENFTLGDEEGSLIFPAKDSEKEAIRNFYPNQIKELEDQIKAEETQVSEDRAEAEKNSKKRSGEDLSYLTKTVDELTEKKKSLEEHMTKSPLPIIYGLRPEDFSSATEGEEGAFSVKVKAAELLGREYIIHFMLGKSEIIARIAASRIISIDDMIYLKVDTSKVRLYDPISTLLMN